MLTASKLIPQGRGLAPALVKRAAAVQLDWDLRQKSRLEAIDSQGRSLAIFLPRGSVLRGGDVLVAEDGSLVRIHAAPQPVLVVRHCPQHGSPFDLLRAAYHLGNRHVPLELQPERLQLEPDHVLAAMLRRMHLIVTEEQAAFEPESGAYGGEGAHAHGHGHGAAHGAGGHEHVHDHGHDHGHERAHDHGPGPHHAHDAAQGHAHAHPQDAHGKAHGHGPCGHDH